MKKQYSSPRTEVFCVKTMNIMAASGKVQQYEYKFEPEETDTNNGEGFDAGDAW